MAPTTITDLDHRSIELADHTHLSMDPVYEGSELNPCFYSDLPASFFQTAALWVHGHTHSSSDYRHHRTRVVANPRGYVRWNGAIENTRFDPKLVITLGAVHD